MSAKLEQLKGALSAVLGASVVSLTEALGELTLVVKSENYLAVARALRDDPALRFEQLVDLCGVDYSAFGEEASAPSTGRAAGERRFAVVCHLLSLAGNWRLRLRAFAPDDDFPLVESLGAVWP